MCWVNMSWNNMYTYFGCVYEEFSKDCNSKNKNCSESQFEFNPQFPSHVYGNPVQYNSPAGGKEIAYKMWYRVYSMR